MLHLLNWHADKKENISFWTRKYVLIINKLKCIKKDILIFQPHVKEKLHVTFEPKLWNNKNTSKQNFFLMVNPYEGIKVRLENNKLVLKRPESYVYLILTLGTWHHRSWIFVVDIYTSVRLNEWTFRGFISTNFQ